MSIACHSVHSAKSVEALKEWRGALVKHLRTGKTETESIDEETLAANRQSALAAARAIGAGG